MIFGIYVGARPLHYLLRFVRAVDLGQLSNRLRHAALLYLLMWRVPLLLQGMRPVCIAPHVKCKLSFPTFLIRLNCCRPSRKPRCPMLCPLEMLFWNTVGFHLTRVLTRVWTNILTLYCTFPISRLYFLLPSFSICMLSKYLGYLNFFVFRGQISIRFIDRTAESDLIYGKQWSAVVWLGPVAALLVDSE